MLTSCSSHNVCCGWDDAAAFCVSHCSCFNSSGVVVCPCYAGFHGDQCTEQEAASSWIAVMCIVGTVLVLFVA